MASDRDNAFTFLRLTLASLVVLAHAFTLGGFGRDPLFAWSRGQLTGGNFSVIGFFVISGFLLTQSLRLHPSLARFCAHRAARILPGYWMVLLLTALILAPALLRSQSPQLSFGELLRLGPYSALEYLANNWTLKAQQFSIASLFRENPGGAAVNGSLWTLYHEAMCYLGLLLLAAFRGLKPGLTGALFAAVYCLQVMDFLDHSAFLQIAPTAAMAGQFFSSALMRPLYLGFLGGMLVQLAGLHRRWEPWWLGGAAAGLALSLPLGLSPIVWPLTLPWLLLALAHRLPWQAVERFGDWSYGIYICAFPIQQGLALAGVPRAGLAVFCAASLVLSFLAGALSWHLVESPILRAVRGWTKPREEDAPALREALPA